MALFETWLTVDLMKGTRKTQIDDTYFYGDESANLIGVRVLSNREPASLSGTCTGYVQRVDGSTVTVPGNVSGNTAYFIMRAACYAYPGPVNIAITLTSGNTTTTLVGIRANVSSSRTDTTVDPGSVIPSLDTLLARINEMQQATAAAQELIDEYADTVGSLGERMTEAEGAIGAAVESTGNLYDSGTRVVGARLSATSGNVGAPGSAVSYDTSDFIPVAAGTAYTVKRWGGTAWASGSNDNLAWYDGSKVYVSGQSIQGVDTVTAPVGAVYMRFSIRKSGGQGAPDAPVKTVVAESSSFPETYVPHWKLVDEIALQSDVTASITALQSSVANDSRFNGYIHNLGYSSLLQCTQPGWYGCSYSYRTSLSDLPADYAGKADSSGFALIVEAPAAASNSALIQTIKSLSGYVWQRSIVNGAVSYDWKRLGSAETLVDDVVAIIGDSISTNGNDGPRPNAVEITVTEEDVGVQLSAYLTYNDVQTGLSLGGHTFTSDEIGTEVTFTPTADDVGKVIGMPVTQYAASMQVWWEYASIGDGGLGFTTIPVCYGGASMSSHEDNNIRYMSTHAWHDSQIRKCGIRTPGTMTRTAPTKIIIFRGVNDFSHSPYALLTEDFFSGASWAYPQTDTVTGGYGYLEALALTIKKCRAAYPEARIYLCTLPAFLRLDVTGFPMTNGTNTLPEYNAAILKAAEFFGCGVIRFDLCWSIENAVSGGYVSSTDKTHPTSKGHRAMGIQAVKDLLK